MRTYVFLPPITLNFVTGRLESLVNFQAMVSSLTSMDIANASLLDEATAAAEGMVMAFVSASSKKQTFIVDSGVVSQTIAVLRTRAKGFGINIVVGDAQTLVVDETIRGDVCGVLIQYPDVNGHIKSLASLADTTHSLGGLVVCATDLLALTRITPPGEWGADIVVGNSARFGVPAGYGGPHAAFFAVTDKLKRKMPGRLIGLSRDTQGNPAYRLALQSRELNSFILPRLNRIFLAREQHIRREKATSNICTSQALLANMAAMYAVYHGPIGLSRIADKVHKYTQVFQSSAAAMGYKLENDSFFDTVTLNVSAVTGNAEALHRRAEAAGINLRHINENSVGVTFDESISPIDLVSLINVFASAASSNLVSLSDLSEPQASSIPVKLQRKSDFLPHPVFNKHHSETEMLRYIHHLASKDISLVHSMIPLGSCTMKLNSTSSMIPLTWPEFSDVHPLAPYDQLKGYHTVVKV